MPLVDYSSSSSSSEEDHDDERRQADEKKGRDQPETVPEPAVKRRKRSPKGDGGKVIPTAVSTLSSSSLASGSEGEQLPPLPKEFHDLYASTVRQSVVDDPSLHQGRKRQIPHVVGNWPSHLYVEWHPSKEQHKILVQLVNDVKQRLGSSVKLHNFLTSDLGAPLPLHISLSRPIALTTASKDDFLEQVSHAIRHSRTQPFSVTPRELHWYRSPDSNRTFLILRVASRWVVSDEGSKSANPELGHLLRLCNRLCSRFKQPVLYQEDEKVPADDAFHISIGWASDLAVDETSTEALVGFAKGEFEAVRSWKIDVLGIKAKIGNVVSNVSLTQTGKDSASSRGSLFGL